MNLRIRVMIVDDQPLFAYGMQLLVGSQPDLEVVGSAGDGLSALDLAAATNPDVVLMDIRMPGMNGIETTAKLTSAALSGTAPRVIILTTFQREEAVFLALKHGASAYLTKDSTPETVLDAIRTVHTGTGLLNPGNTTALVEEFAALPTGSVTTQSVLSGLTSREIEVYLMAARGMSNTDIAAASHTTEATTKTHVRSIMRKLQLRSRVQLVVHAYENGTLRPGHPSEPSART